MKEDFVYIYDKKTMELVSQGTVKIIAKVIKHCRKNLQRVSLYSVMSNIQHAKDRTNRSAYGYRVLSKDLFIKNIIKG
jgi:hypothetical protein